MNRTSLLLILIAGSTVGILAYIFVPVFLWLYEDYKVERVVTEIFEDKQYEDIFLEFCYEEKCFYSFGPDKDQVDIYTVGRDDIGSRIELARKVANAWPEMNGQCKTLHLNSCQL